MTGQATQGQLDAQVGVIGSLLLDPTRCAGEVFLRTREDQYTGEYRTLFQAARSLHQEGKPIDPVTVKAIVGQEHTPLLLQIMDLTPTAVNCSAYIDLLIQEAHVNRLQALGLALAGCKTTEEGRDLLEEANKALVQQSALRVVDVSAGLVDFFGRQNEKAEYIPWGFPKLSDTVLTSLGDLVILGGRPSAGKTALSLQMAWEQSKTWSVGYFSFETNPDEVYDRLFSMALGLDSGKVRRRKLEGPDFDRILAESDALRSRKLDVIHASGMTVADMRSVAVAKGYQIIYADYLQIIDAGRGMDRRDRFGIVSQISMDLHRMAVSLGVLVVALSQLSRPEKQARSKAPDLYSLRESGQIEQDADAVMLLWKTDEEERTSPRRLRIAKNKKGFAGGYMELDFDGATQTFREKPSDKQVMNDLAATGRAVKEQNRRKARQEQEVGPLFQDLPDDEEVPF